jgi:hypothetical protein
MSPTLPGVDLNRVSTRCAKLKCRTRDFVLHRHHKGHQYMFVKVFAWRVGTPQYDAFVRRYFEYRDEDCVRICASHHREIHEKYDAIIQWDMQKLGKRLHHYTWTQAEALMDKLITQCNDWLEKRTKGSKTPWPSNGHTKRRAEDAETFLREAANLNRVPF